MTSQNELNFAELRNRLIKSDELLTLLEDLQKQARTEKSHYYVGSVVSKAIELIKADKAIIGHLLDIIELQNKKAYDVILGSINLFSDWAVFMNEIQSSERVFSQTPKKLQELINKGQ